MRRRAAFLAMLGWILLSAGLASTLGCEKPSEPLVVGDALPI